jgi:hypothetical protein
MDSKQKRLFLREMERRGIIAPKKEPKTTILPTTSDRLTDRLIRFIEQPLFLASFGIVGGIVGLIYTPSLAIVGLCIGLAFHRAKVVSDKSWKIQIPAYVLVFAGAFAIVYSAINLIKKAVHIPTATEVATELAKHFPIVSQITNVYPTTQTIRATPDQPHTYIYFDNPQIFGGWPNSGSPPFVNLSYRNGTDVVVLHASHRGALAMGKLGRQYQKGLFEEFIKKATFSSTGPLTPKGETHWKTWQLDDPKSYDPSTINDPDSALYLTAAVRWQDASGYYETDACRYFILADGQWHFCNDYNGERKITKKEFSKDLYLDNK